MEPTGCFRRWEAGQTLSETAVGKSAFSGAFTDYLKCRFEPTKFLRAQFGEHFHHLPGMLSKGSHNEVFAARHEVNGPHAPVFGALDPPRLPPAFRVAAIVDRDW
jgi:hypothetical protein